MSERQITTAQDISDRLERLIMDGSLLPEEKIPSERQLAARYSVSRAIVREALHELQGRGLIETRHGRGSFVAPMLPEPHTDSPLLKLFAGHPRTLYDLLEVREQLEGQAAYLAAERASQRDRYLITKAFEDMTAADPLTNARRDHAFHLAIVEASHNPVLVHLLSSVKQLMLMTVQASVANLNPRENFRQRIHRQHQRILRTILAGQPRAARNAAMAHVRYVSDSMHTLEAMDQGIIWVDPNQRPDTNGD
ncbi:MULTISPECIES: FCD domain-containing protein [Marinobacter]|jgi:DNA-binding FadR family transcriptional regulator|uniref:FCD domain-containing protein n=1 Tax=Marinobacter xestospongiae TaxID=994319 RepID=A0ABU3W278_9GAMM|nr:MULTISPECIES: FCD domain-containing protein [Marinobacter]MCG8520121.1 FCD domain-containing protein [Pseudomonadales bacterium]MCK7565019.1 FCD domain-containing protein [Marinobacter xestospongiae]MDV2080521.1 FCD domain-containing protein [Marinobacter xestospongiae]UDL05804.1 FCD domain-containing protein [Marinobacter sp. CA1]